ncbi:hypothetical protein F5Y14DRAFT_434661 [Nemania sp. NC0429]|nr:hypothetical protein F5Y14DRAFT_434661 [Nemania sp. NC0429]
MASLLPRARAARLPLPRALTTTTSASTTTTSPASISPSPSPARPFTSTPHQASQQRVPPESPHFINVPNPPQDQSIEARRELKPVRGFVPVPRRVFAHRDSHEKPTDAWVSRATPLSAREKAGQDPRSELEAWKRRMAAGRRENMRAGLGGLWARKQSLDASRSAVRAAKLAANRAAAIAPEREDERLTRGTVNAGTLQTAVAPDPERFERAQASAARSAALAADRSQARCDAVQALYMNARSFIVGEAELEALVNAEFADDHFDAMGQGGAGYRVQNIWDAQSAPMSVADMLRELQRDNDTLVSDMTTEKTRTVRRQKRVAEELTGGKMDRLSD